MYNVGVRRSAGGLQDHDHELRSDSGEMDPECDIAAEEVRSIMEVIATTGRLWHDWDMLKNILSFRMKQVLAEYPESETVSGNGSQQISVLGDTYPELVKRLDEALLSFIEGPPFTLQRFCEILLNPKGTYRSLFKLARALEKNLLVTSTLTICTDPYPSASVPKPKECDELWERTQSDSCVASNGVDTVVGCGDVEMAEADAEVVVMNTDMEMRDEKAVEANEEKVFPSSDMKPRAAL